MMARRWLLVLLFAVLAALRLSGDFGGGGGGGDGGVWILPRFRIVTSETRVGTPSQAVATHHFPTTANGLTLRLPSSFGSATATMMDRNSGLPQPLPIVDNEVLISREIIEGLLGSGALINDIFVVNGNCDGYVMTLVLDRNGGADLYVF